MTDDYWGPMPDDSEYPTPRERLDDGEADRLRALLRRWMDMDQAWGSYPDWVWLEVIHWVCRRCHTFSSTDEFPRWQDMKHALGCIVGDTLKELGE